MRSAKIVITIMLFCTVWCSVLLAQMNITTEILTVRNGLSNNNARNIIQDKIGYMWFATADGINRYDGYEIIVYKNIPGDTTSLPANVTFRMYGRQ